MDERVAVGEAGLAERIEQASPETRELIDRILEQDAADQAWGDLVGPAYRQSQVADLLGRTKQAVSANPHLLRLEERSGAVVYPVLQFDGRRVLPGVADVVAVLSPAVATTWTIASWLASPHRDLDGRRPVDALRGGDVDAVVAAARRAAGAWSR